MTELLLLKMDELKRKHNQQKTCNTKIVMDSLEIGIVGNLEMNMNKIKWKISTALDEWKFISTIHFAKYRTLAFEPRTQGLIRDSALFNCFPFECVNQKLSVSNENDSSNPRLNESKNGTRRSTFLILNIPVNICETPLHANICSSMG